MHPDELESLWREYELAEQCGLREPMLIALETFIDALRARGTATVDQWVASHVRQPEFREGRLPLRFPFARSILAPSLVRGVLREEPRAASALAVVLTRTNHSLVGDLGALPDTMRSTNGLLAEALRVDPSDDQARRDLVDSLAGYLAYTLHELPSGVLFGHDGATAEECEELADVLNEFVQHVERLGESARYRQLIDDCRHHYERYAVYLRTRTPGQDYATFLASGHAT